MQETLLGGLYTRGTQRNSNALADTREHGQLLVHSFDSTTPADRQSRATAMGRHGKRVQYGGFNSVVRLILRETFTALRLYS